MVAVAQLLGSVHHMTRPDASSDRSYGSAGDKVATGLRRMIADGHLRPGEHLRQDDLARQLDTTRVPVREAFKTLVAEGVLEHRRNRGHYVTKLTSLELSQVAWLRNTCEAELVATGRKVRASDIENLREANRRLAEVPIGSTSVLNQADRDFHQLLWALSSRRIIAAEVGRMWTLLQPYRSFMDYGPAVLTRICAEHEMITDALAAGDLDEARRMVAQHHGHIFGQIEDLVSRQDLDIFAG